MLVMLLAVLGKPNKSANPMDATNPFSLIINNASFDVLPAGI
jgi:hypothetical protein